MLDYIRTGTDFFFVQRVVIGIVEMNMRESLHCMIIQEINTLKNAKEATNTDLDEDERLEVMEENSEAGWIRVYCVFETRSPPENSEDILLGNCGVTQIAFS